jgi:uncharacterized protein
MFRVSTHTTDPGSRESTPTVTVRGEAVLRVEPDEAMLWVTLSALEPDPGQALADVSHRSDALVAMLDDLGIAKQNRSTTRVTVHEEFDHTRSGRRSLGHRAAASISARLTDPELIGRLITKATTELHAKIDGPQWQIAAPNPVRLEAAREAAADAQRKAQAFAEGVGAQLGSLIKLVEPGTDARPHRSGFRPVAFAAAGGEEQMQIEPGEHEVTAAVDATFALKPA